MIKDVTNVVREYRLPKMLVPYLCSGQYQPPSYSESKAGLPICCSTSLKHWYSVPHGFYVHESSYLFTSLYLLQPLWVIFCSCIATIMELPNSLFLQYNAFTNEKSNPFKRKITPVYITEKYTMKSLWVFTRLDLQTPWPVTSVLMIAFRHSGTTSILSSYSNTETLPGSSSCRLLLLPKNQFSVQVTLPAKQSKVISLLKSHSPLVSP